MTGDVGEKIVLQKEKWDVCVPLTHKGLALKNWYAKSKREHSHLEIAHYNVVSSGNTCPFDCAQIAEEQGYTIWTGIL